MSASGDADALAAKLRAAIERRRPLLDRHDTDVARLFNGDADGVPGLVLERLGPALIVQFHLGKLAFSEATVKAAITDIVPSLGVHGAIRKLFPKDRTRPDPQVESANRDATPWLGSAVAEEVEVREHGLKYLVRPHDGFSTGLFLDHREQRQFIREISTGKHVLNTFAYTCAFSVAAGAGGAEFVANVDLSKRYLEWGKRNVQLNNMTENRHWYFCSDVLAFYERAQRQGRRFDVAILDPPTFSRSGAGKTFRVQEDLVDLMRGAMNLLNSQGILLTAVNDARATAPALREALSGAARAARRRIVSELTLGTPVDFAGDPLMSKVQAIQLD